MRSDRSEHSERSPYKGEATLGNILAASLGSQLTKRFEVASSILNLWPAILPRHLAENCKPSMLIKGVLTVECLSPSYLFDLRCESPNILARLRARVGNKVHRLHLVLEGHV
jgi:hypothetical protein